jgi:hypothetical protein
LSTGQLSTAHEIVEDRTAFGIFAYSFEQLRPQDIAGSAFFAT